MAPRLITVLGGGATLVNEQPRDLSDPGKGASLAQSLESAMNFSRSLSALEALTVSIPWEADAQGHICRSGNPGWTEAGETGGECAPDRCGRRPSLLPCASPNCLPQVLLQTPGCAENAASQVRLRETECFLQPPETLVALQALIPCHVSLPFLGSSFCLVVVSPVPILTGTQSTRLNSLFHTRFSKMLASAL